MSKVREILLYLRKRKPDFNISAPDFNDSDDCEIMVVEESIANEDVEEILEENELVQFEAGKTQRGNLCLLYKGYYRI